MKNAAAVEPPVIGYSTGGRLIRGRRRGKGGTWLVLSSEGESVFVQMSNALDRKVLGANDGDPVVVLFKSGGDARRYLARNTSFMSISPEVAEDKELLEKLMREWAGWESGDHERE